MLRLPRTCQGEPGPWVTAAADLASGRGASPLGSGEQTGSWSTTGEPAFSGTTLGCVSAYGRRSASRPAESREPGEAGRSWRLRGKETVARKLPRVTGYGNVCRAADRMASGVLTNRDLRVSPRSRRWDGRARWGRRGAVFRCPSVPGPSSAFAAGVRSGWGGRHSGHVRVLGTYYNF